MNNFTIVKKNTVFDRIDNFILKNVCPKKSILNVYNDHLEIIFNKIADRFNVKKYEFANYMNNGKCCIKGTFSLFKEIIFHCNHDIYT